MVGCDLHHLAAVGRCVGAGRAVNIGKCRRHRCVQQSRARTDGDESPAVQAGSIQPRERSTARSHVWWPRSASVRSGSGSNVASICHRSLIVVDRLPHAFGQTRQICGTERRGLLVDRALNNDAQLVRLHLQQHVHHRRAPVDAQCGECGAARRGHRLDRVAGLIRHGLDDGPGNVRLRRTAGDPHDRASRIGIPPRAAEPCERGDHIDTTAIGSAGRQGPDLGRGLDQAQAVAQPLDCRARDENGALQRIRRRFHPRAARRWS